MTTSPSSEGLAHQQQYKAQQERLTFLCNQDEQQGAAVASIVMVCQAAPFLENLDREGSDVLSVVGRQSHPHCVLLFVHMT